MKTAPSVLPTDILLVGFDFTHGDDNRILIVGHKEGEYLQIVNAFEGQKAEDIYRLLTTIVKTAPGVLPADTLLVNFDFTHGDDNRILIVGHKEGERLQIINAFAGQKAEDIYHMLVDQEAEE